jgi:hypothetical protein
MQEDELPNVHFLCIDAAGLLAALSAAEEGVSVLLLEKMEKLGKKILIAGQGQCNLTHTGTREDFINKYGKNGAFLKKAFYKYPPEALIDFFEKTCFGGYVPDEAEWKMVYAEYKAQWKKLTKREKTTLELDKNM